MSVQNAKSPNVVPIASERASYITALVAHGYRSQALANAIKAGLTRREIADRIITMQRGAIKG